MHLLDTAMALRCNVEGDHFMHGNIHNYLLPKYCWTLLVL